MRTLLLAALIAGSAAPATRAATAAPADQDSNRTWEDYRIKTRAALDVLEDKIAKLESSQAQALRAKKSDADRLFGQLETATEEARKELRTKLDRALRELEQSVHKAEAKPRDRT